MIDQSDVVIGAVCAALKTAWDALAERDQVIANLQQQNTELLEDVAALRIERDAVFKVPIVEEKV